MWRSWGFATRGVNEAMDAGAIGISMSVMGADGNSHVDFDGTPMPTDIMDPDVMIELGRAVAERGEGVIQMLSHGGMCGDRRLTERMGEMAKASRAGDPQHLHDLRSDARKWS